MPKSIEGLAEMISQRDTISYEKALAEIRDCAAEMEQAFYDGSLDDAEKILQTRLGVNTDYMNLFIF